MESPTYRTGRRCRSRWRQATTWWPRPSGRRPAARRTGLPCGSSPTPWPVRWQNTIQLPTSVSFLSPLTPACVLPWLQDNSCVQALSWSTVSLFTKVWWYSATTRQKQTVLITLTKKKKNKIKRKKSCRHTKCFTRRLTHDWRKLGGWVSC